MLGLRSDQRGLFEADHIYLGHVGRHSFYGFLALMRGQLFRTRSLPSYTVWTTGATALPPSLLPAALLLQTHDRTSDEEAKERADFDIRWKVTKLVQQRTFFPVLQSY